MTTQQNGAPTGASIDLDPPKVASPPLIISAADLLAESEQLLQDGAESALWWSTHVMTGAVTLLVGETSAGKTVFLRRLARALALGEEFLGHKPPRPLRVLQLDFESYPEVWQEHLRAISPVPGWDFIRPSELEKWPKGQKGLEFLARVTKGRYDVTLVDSLMELYPVDDVNDTSEAEEQMKAYRTLARSTRSALIVTYNSGHRAARQAAEKRADNKFLIRGASVRVDKTDVAINYTQNGDDERVLTVVKTRLKGLGDQMNVRFSGALDFELLDGWGGDAQAEAGVVAAMKAQVLDIARAEATAGRTTIKREAFMAHLNIQRDTKEEKALSRALRDLTAPNVTERVLFAVPGKRGVYTTVAPIIPGLN